MDSRIALLLLAVVLSGASSACGDSRPDAGTAGPSGAEVGAPQGPEAVPEARTERPPGPGCIRGGTSRAEVLALMGEPDSVSFGAWLYGRSEITFGYGTVLDFTNEDGNLVLC